MVDICRAAKRLGKYRPRDAFRPEVNSTWLIISELANQRARKVQFTCVAYTKTSYRNTRESLGELEKAVETLACGSCSHSISRSQTSTRISITR